MAEEHMSETDENTISAERMERRTMSSCERELQDIQNILEGLSSDLGSKIDSKSGHHAPSKKEEDKSNGSANSLSLDMMLTCGDREFESHVNRMSLTDLDLTKMVLQEEVKMVQDYMNQMDSLLDESELQMLAKKMSVLQDRVFRCVTKKGDIVKTGIQMQFTKKAVDMNSDKVVPPKPPRFKTRGSLKSQELEDLTVEQLQLLLRRNNINFNPNSHRKILIQKLKDKVLKGENSFDLESDGSEEEGEISSWEPPDSAKIQWKNVFTFNFGSKNKTSGNDPSNGTDSPNHGDMSEDVDDRLKLIDVKKMLEWDPTPLVRQLCGRITEASRVKKKAATVRIKAVSSMQGYLDKLPVNQTKAKTLKGWKKRWFQVMRGKLYYYEDAKSESPFGGVDLLAATITASGDRCIHVTSKTNGDTLVIRCKTDAECSDWVAALNAASSIEKMPASTLSEVRKDKSAVVVIDIGSSSIRAGFTSSDDPEIAFPSAYAVKMYDEEGRRFTVTGLPDPHLCKIGFEAFSPASRKDAKMVYPLRPMLTVDKYLIKTRFVPGFFEKVFHDLAVDSHGKTVIISCPKNLRVKDKEFLLDYLFGQMNVRAVLMQQQAVLALYSHSVTSGLIVDIGDHIDVIPVLDGAVIQKGESSLPFGGQQITEHLGKLLTESGYRFFSEIESYVVRYIKEQVAFASPDFNEDMMSSPDLVKVDVSDFNLPDGLKAIDVGSQRYRCVEGLFCPSMWGKDNKPLHDLVLKAIKAVDVHDRRDLCKNIFLTGGTSMIPGLAARLQLEIKRSMPESIVVQVTAADHRLNAAFRGASIISHLPTFTNLLVTTNEWQEMGVASLKKWDGL